MQKNYITSEVITNKLKRIRENIEDHIKNKSIHKKVKIEYKEDFDDKRKGL